MVRTGLPADAYWFSQFGFKMGQVSEEKKRDYGLGIPFWSPYNRPKGAPGPRAASRPPHVAHERALAPRERHKDRRVTRTTSADRVDGAEQRLGRTKDATARDTTGLVTRSPRRRPRCHVCSRVASIARSNAASVASTSQHGETSPRGRPRAAAGPSLDYSRSRPMKPASEQPLDRASIPASVTLRLPCNDNQVKVRTALAERERRFVVDRDAPTQIQNLQPCGGRARYLRDCISTNTAAPGAVEAPQNIRLKTTIRR